MPKYEITTQESGRYIKIIDADNLKDIIKHRKF